MVSRTISEMIRRVLDLSWASSALGCEAETWHACGLTHDITCLIALPLPAASIAWKINGNA
jgi:hypothetical protein